MSENNWNDDNEQAEASGTIDQLIKWAYTENIAELLDEETLEKIGADAHDDYEKDSVSHGEWVEKNKKWLDAAMLIKEEKSYPWTGCANVKYPVLNEACFQFNARAMPALFPGSSVAKAATTGKDEDGSKQDRAERISKHMSFQLLEEMKGWRKSMDRGMMVIPASGSFFKKTSWDFEKRQPASDIVWPQNLVVNSDYSDMAIEDVPCISEPFEEFDNEVEAKKRTGRWLDVDFDEEKEDEEKTETSDEFIEQHRWIDLDDDGYKEPYIVIFHVESKKVVRIRARYDEECLYVNLGGKLQTIGTILRKVEEGNQNLKQGLMQRIFIAAQKMRMGANVPRVAQPQEIKPPDFSGVEVAKIDAECSYIKYYFMPSMDGSFYEMGLGQVVESISDTIDSNLNQMLDAGTLANLQGGFKAKEAKIAAGNARVAPGEYKDVDTRSMALKDAIMPFNFPGPSAQSFSLLSFLIEGSKAITSVTGVMVGDQDPNAPATTALINQEEGAKVFNAVYQRLYDSFKQELRNIYHLNRKYLDEEKYFKVLDEEIAIKKSDYTFDETDVQPVADPKVSTLAQSIAEAQMLMQFVGDPEFDATAIKRRYLEAARVTNIDDIMPPKDPNAPPPPEYLMQLEGMKKEFAEKDAKTLELYTKAIKNIAEAEGEEAGQQLAFYKSFIEMMTPKGGQGGAQDTGER